MNLHLPQRRLKVSAPVIGAGGLGIKVARQYHDTVVVPRQLDQVCVGTFDTSRANEVAALTPTDRLKFYQLDASRLGEVESQIRRDRLWRRDFEPDIIDLQSVNVPDKGVLKVPQRAGAIAIANLQSMREQFEEVLTVCSYPHVIDVDQHMCHITIMASLAGGSGMTIGTLLALVSHVVRSQAGVGGENIWVRLVVFGPTLYKGREDFMPIQYGIGGAQLRVLNALAEEGSETRNPALAGPFPGFDPWLGSDQIITPGFVGQICFIEGVDSKDDPSKPSRTPDDVYAMEVTYNELRARCPDYVEHEKEAQIQERDNVKALVGEEGVARCFSTYGLVAFRTPQLAGVERALARVQACQSALGPEKGPAVALGFNPEAILGLVDQFAQNMGIPAVDEMAQDFVDNPSAASASYLEKLGKQPAIFKREFANATPGRPLDAIRRAKALADEIEAEIDTAAARGNWRGLAKSLGNVQTKLVAIRDLPFPEEDLPDTAEKWQQKIDRPARLIAQRLSDLDVAWEKEKKKADRGVIKSFLLGVKTAPKRPNYGGDQEVSEQSFANARYIQGQMLRQARQEAWERRSGIAAFVLSRVQQKFSQLFSLCQSMEQAQQVAEAQSRQLYEECQESTVINYVMKPGSLETIASSLVINSGAIARVAEAISTGTAVSDALAQLDSEVQSGGSIKDLFLADTEAQAEFHTRAESLTVQARINLNNLGAFKYKERRYIICAPELKAEFESRGLGARFTIMTDSGLGDVIYLLAQADTLPARVFAATAECEYALQNLDTRHFRRSFPFDRFKDADPLTDDYIDEIAELIGIAVVARPGDKDPALYLMPEAGKPAEAIFGKTPPDAKCPLQQVDMEVELVNGGKAKIPGWQIQIAMPTGNPFLMPLYTEHLADVARRIYRDHEACQLLRSYVRALCEGNKGLVARGFIEAAEKEARGWLARQDRQEQRQPFASVTDPTEIAARQQAARWRSNIEFVQAVSLRLSERESWVEEITKEIRVNFLRRTGTI